MQQNLIVLIAFEVILNYIFPSPPSKEEIIKDFLTYRDSFEDSKNTARNLDKYIGAIKYSKYNKPKNLGIKGLYTGGLFEGDYVEKPMANKAIESLFHNTGIRVIYINNNSVDFAGQGAGREYYCGITWTADGKPIGFDGSKMELKASGTGWEWKEESGDNKYHTEEIIDNWYYYEMSF